MSGERNRKDRSEGDETIQPPYDMCRPEEQAQNLRQWRREEDGTGGKMPPPALLKRKTGGRVVAGSNPVTPTDEKSLIFNRISRIFLLWYIVRKMAVVHKWYINGRYSKNFNLSR